ncbi:hypothetical protein F5883DRAFT_637477 [Diaporthe sp. PMI_573]|nr:hypothetical protein F5883DRAFT_637477 [Diaporthaceae sp. PMI_573]
MYEDYTEPLCPAPKHLDHQGACDGSRDTQQDCSSFCQLTTTYVWASESPLFRSECHYPMRCEPRETDSTEWFVDGYISGNAQFQKAIDAGITGGIGSSSGRAIGHSWSVTPAPGECGYFTWVPVVKRTCGIVTSSLKIGTSEEGLKCLNKTTTVHDVCHDQVWPLEGGPDGVVLWVRTNCSFRMPLGPEYQDPVYNSPGVSLYDFSGISMFDGWRNNTCVMTVLNAVSEGTWYELQIN